jgi:toxin secretion/phage lysis holin
MKEFNYVSVVIGFIGGFFVQYLGGFDKFLYGLLCLMVIDYISGLIKAAYNQKLSSQIGFKGILKKIMVLVVVAASVVVQNTIGGSNPIREITIVFYMCNEGISILENAGEFLPIPKRLKDIFIQLRNNESIQLKE